MVVIVDYGLGNLRSVAGAIAKIGHPVLISHKVSELEKADKLILPGVGAFGDGMQNLRKRDLVEPLNRLVLKERRPILGICLGAQLAARESCEFGHHAGLGWIDAEVLRLNPSDPALRVPHVGWNDLKQVRESILFADIPPDALFYYVHSFHVQCNDKSIVIGESEHGMRFVAAYRQANIFGTQFHPEKSQQHGLQMLRNFLDRG